MGINPQRTPYAHHAAHSSFRKNVRLFAEAKNAFIESFLTALSFSVIERLKIQTRGNGLREITKEVQEVVLRAALEEALCTVFIRHTSASLLIQENADPSAKRDLETWLNRFVSENDPLYTHTAEGPDDMPSHIKAALTPASLAIPIIHGELALGTWQGIYLWEHRRQPHSREIVVQVIPACS